MGGECGEKRRKEGTQEAGRKTQDVLQISGLVHMAELEQKCQILQRT
jgi:hypothetical protein